MITRELARHTGFPQAMLAATLALATLWGCGDDDDASGGVDAGRPEASEALGRACAASCENQESLPCPPIAACTAFCEARGLADPGCEAAWIELNECMADDDLICSHDGSPSTIDLACRDLADTFTECSTGEPPPVRDPAEDTCTRACLRSDNVRCPEDDLIECIEECDERAADPDCGQAWLAVAGCHADDPAQTCDDGGNAATSDPDCLVLFETWEACSP